MAKKKVLEERVQMVIIPTNPKEILILKRPWKLLNPIPYKFLLNLKNINDVIRKNITP
jgi:hypothetical protein